MATDRPTTNPSALPVVGLLSDDDDVLGIMNSLAESMGFLIDRMGPASACVIDPAVGPGRVRDWLKNAGDRPAAAVIPNPDHGGAMLVAFRKTRASLLRLSANDTASLQTFLESSVPGLAPSTERRGYPRAPADGIAVSAPSDTVLVDISPYGALVESGVAFEKGARLELKVRFERHGRDETLGCAVAASFPHENRFRTRLKFREVTEWTQKEVFKIVKAHLLCATIEATLRRADSNATGGYRRLSDANELAAFLGQLATDHAGVTFAALDAGRAMQGKMESWDAAARTVTIAVEHAPLLRANGSVVRFSATAGKDVLLVEAELTATDEKLARVAFPNIALRNDSRAEVRLPLSREAPVTVAIDRHSFEVTDLSPNGFSFFVPSDVPFDRTAGFEDARFVLGDHVEHIETVRITGTRDVDGGRRIGAGFMGSAGVSFRGAPIPLVEEEFSGAGIEIVQAERPYFAERVVFGAPDRPVVGLWNEVVHPGPKTVVIVPPAWGRTKESSSLLAQFLAACFDASKRHIGILRLDYINARGESYKDPEFRDAGRETLGFKGSVAMENIRDAIGWASLRSGSPESVVLIGMSISGPLCLRVAADDDRVTHLVQLMGASDPQDLVRNASGGVDYVANHRAGLRLGHQNVLGVLSDPAVWVEDGLVSSLAELRDSLAAAGRLRVPVLWILGQHDGFIDPTRIRQVLEACPQVERQLLLVPCGHVPTQTSEALAAYVPIARRILPDIALGNAIGLPTEEQAMLVMSAEWSGAPKEGFVSPTDYWRKYMLGANDQSLGYEMLAMTREYQSLMADQVASLAATEGAVVADIGCGLGHSLPHLVQATGTSAAAFQFYDVVPELLVKARERWSGLSTTRASFSLWNAADEEPPEALQQSTHVLMSLFLSVLPSPREFLRSLRRVLRPGTIVIASSMKPDADMSVVFLRFISDLERGSVAIPKGLTAERLLNSAREYVNSAAHLLRLAEEGTFHFFTNHELRAMFEDAGYSVRSVDESFGPPYQANFVRAVA